MELGQDRVLTWCRDGGSGQNQGGDQGRGVSRFGVIVGCGVGIVVWVGTSMRLGAGLGVWVKLGIGIWIGVGVRV